MHPQRPPPSGPTSGFRPQLATTVQLGLFGVLLLFALAIWLSMPLLGGIVDKANQVRDEYLPELTRWRYNTQRVEQLYGFIQTLYWTSDSRAARSSRLQAQVLVDSFAFAPDSALAERAGQTLLHLQNLARLRDAQRDTLAALQQRAAALLAALPGDGGELARFAAASSHLGLIGSDWQALQQQAQALPDSGAPPGAQHLLGALQAQFGQLHALETQIGAEHRQALEQQKQLAATLNTDTALKTQQIATAVEHEASQVRRYGLLVLLLLGAITVLVLYAFQRHLLRPILLCNQALEQLNGERPVQLPPPTLFHELDTICHSVREYSNMTRQLQLANRELMQLSQQDGLTGLSNRRHFDAMLAAEHARASRHGHALTLILLDIDHFKKLNDRYGHLFGDDCLRHLGAVLTRSCQRAGDLAARYGGEEFALILPELNLEQSLALAERLRRSVAELVTRTDAGEPVSFTISAGLMYAEDCARHTPAGLILQADQALYRAKQHDRNRVEVAGESLVAG